MNCENTIKIMKDSELYKELLIIIGGIEGISTLPKHGANIRIEQLIEWNDSINDIIIKLDECREKILETGGISSSELM